MRWYCHVWKSTKPQAMRRKIRWLPPVGAHLASSGWCTTRLGVFLQSVWSISISLSAGLLPLDSLLLSSPTEFPSLLSTSPPTTVLAAQSYSRLHSGSIRPLVDLSRLWGSWHPDGPKQHRLEIILTRVQGQLWRPINPQNLQRSFSPCPHQPLHAPWCSVL